MLEDREVKARAEEQLVEITRGAADIHSEERLRELLEESIRTGRRLLVKAGFDPTAPDIHLGHTVLLARMRRFQRFGHLAVFVMGDLTASIGDPSGRTSTRPVLDRETIIKNAETYRDQALKILDPELTQLRFNSEWLSELGVEGMIRLASHYTVARMLEREDFKQRFRSGLPISVHELLYPLLQGYDSVALHADVELGGTDQLFNLLVGRELMRDYGLPPQVVMTSPLLEGIDAKEIDGEIVGEKMSKSLDNYVGIDEEPEEIFGKLMSITDGLMWRYYELLSELDTPGLEDLKKQVEQGRVHPKAAKARLASEIVARYHGSEAAEKAAEAFDRVHGRRELPDEIPLAEVVFEDRPRQLAVVMAETGLVSSNSEARRLIKQGGVRVDGERFEDPLGEIDPKDHLIQVGKRRFLRLTPAEAGS